MRYQLLFGASTALSFAMVLKYYHRADNDYLDPKLKPFLVPILPILLNANCRLSRISSFGPVNIKAMEEQILKNVRYFCDHFIDANDSQWSSPRNMSEVIGSLISDIMGDITFSKSWDVQSKVDNRDLLASLP
ncbi:hypothetical protein BCR34DRAFT_607297 [Clohesyomyces aquaticus]|uniref:Cytochrome P450 n=1 Tax=Clohesyomyces aquaticus TaxID=1231657 RepID=A0A1Y1YHE6_9PLEO|nr:hypothetical protein BCR34DRAFT_607297 [Clohesyomyces aquaticus]